jgi:hypothetical protein
MSASNPVQTWHKILEEHNLAGLDTLLADEAVFHSPVVVEPQEGKEITKMYLTAASKVLGPTVSYVREVQSGSHAILEFTAEVNGTPINGVDMMTWNEDGQIMDFKVMVRPLPAIEAVKKAMKRELVAMARAARDAERTS